MNISEKVILARKRSGMTSAELARRSNISRSYLSAIEKGTIKNPSFDTVMRLAFELNVNPLDWWNTPNGELWSLRIEFNKNEMIGRAFDRIRKLDPDDF